MGHENLNTEETANSDLGAVSGSLSWIKKDDLAGKRLIELYNEQTENSILFEISSKVLRQLIIEGIDIGLNYR